MPKAKPTKAGYLWGGASTPKPKRPRYSGTMTRKALIDAIQKRKRKSI